jgi:tetratricopeptide (TPR) repeat protein
MCCRAEGTKLKCPCNGALYCGSRCQKLDWGVHKNKCTVALGKELVEMRREHGNNTLEVASTELIIANIFHTRGQFEDAEKSLLESVRIRRYLLGNTHDYVAKVLARLSQVYMGQGRFAEAKKTGNDALRIFRTNQGHDSMSVGKMLTVVGTICVHQGEHERGLEKYEESLRIFRASKSGEAPENLALVLGNIAICYNMLNKPVEGLEKQVEAMEIQLKTPSLCDNHPDIAMSLVNLADLYMDADRLDEALGNLNKALPILRHCHGEKHPSVAEALQKVGMIFAKQGKLDEALKVSKKGLKYLRRFLGDSNEDVASSICQLALIHMIRNEFDKALVLFEEGLGIFGRRLDKNHPKVGATHGRIALCKETLGDRGGALASAMEAHRIHSELGTSHARETQQDAKQIQRLQNFILGTSTP